MHVTTTTTSPSFSSQLETTTATISSILKAARTTTRTNQRQRRQEQRNEARATRQSQSSSNSFRRRHHNRPFFEESIICPGCRFTANCGQLIDSALEKLGDGNVSRALEETVRRSPESCGRHCICQEPAGGKNNNKTSYFKYWYFDHIFPPPSSTSTTETKAVTHYLQCIPKKSRVPNNVDELKNTSSFNVTLWMHEKWQNGKQFDILFEYNPTVAILPPSMQRQLQMSLPKQDIPVYVASFRVTGNNDCYPHETVKSRWNVDQFKKLFEHNYLGLALLNANLGIISGCELVVDLEGEMFRGLPSMSRFSDFRLYAFDDKLYLNINGPPVYVVPIHLSFPNDTTKTHSATKKMTFKDLKNDQLFENNSPVVVPNMFAGKANLQLSLQQTPGTIFGQTRGKNYALFQTPHMAQEHIVAAQFSLTPHVVQLLRLDQINFLSPCEHWERSKSDNGIYPLPNEMCNSTDPERRSSKSIRVRAAALQRREIMPAFPNQAFLRESSDEHDVFAPKSSFATIDELWFPGRIFKRLGHGGACCVSMMRHTTTTGNDDDDDDDDDMLLFVGVGHTKVPFLKWMNEPQNADRLKETPHHQYASFFYAFEPYRHENNQNYRMVAHSGLFCLPFATSQQELSVNAYHFLAQHDHLRLKGHEFDCPKISFVSSIVQHATQPEMVIISYGINDCTPRMLVVDKHVIAKLLFDGVVDNDEK